MAETRPRSFRIDEETAARFKQITEDLGESQQAVMARLIDAYELEQSKAALPEKASAIEDFQAHAAILVQTFLASLEENKRVRELVAADFESSLRSKDGLIKDLQGQLEDQKKKTETAKLAATEADGRSRRLQEELERSAAEYASKVADLQSLLSERDRLNAALSDACASLRGRNKELEAAADREAETAARLAAVQKELASVSEKLEKEEKENGSLSEALAREKEGRSADLQHAEIHEKAALEQQARESSLAIEKAAMEAEKRLIGEIEQMRAGHRQEVNRLKKEIERVTLEKQTAVDDYQGRYLELLKRMGSSVAKDEEASQ